MADAAAAVACPSGGALVPVLLRKSRPEGGASMQAVLKKLVADDAGQDLAEYGIALAIITVAAAAAVIAIKGDVQTLWNNAKQAIHQAL
jgi:Flp pilus assembly pilin Flp